ncbi:MAG: hypothetical protein DWQ18_02785 [Crenarchaeota archaeon]|nr:MAG: hypothetical protein DWQ17_05745 [Thermoproteota archaeon]RDJ33857.1 MAG: hypothetical protein DWQ18_02785 [Thermoproteota archaeon]RDJ37033.1 MAG: hypothetical protein DWQ13_07835 [Thermoproteota archaeon]RDJ37432.1 MAG: hypothetical protein DWQ19_03000 [Thermoproteota archaeon]
MRDSETFGVEKGFGQKVVDWLNEQSQENDLKFEARLYGYDLDTDNFGSFEMFSWIGNVQSARKLIIKASKRFKVKVIEGGYKTKEKIFHMKKSDYGMVRRGDKVIGHIEFESSRFGKDNWKIKAEERR